MLGNDIPDGRKRDHKYAFQVQNLVAVNIRKRETSQHRCEDLLSWTIFTQYQTHRKVHLYDDRKEECLSLRNKIQLHTHTLRWVKSRNPGVQEIAIMSVNGMCVLEGHFR